MTSSSLNLAWPPPCQQCSGHAETSKRQQDLECEQTGGVDQWRLPEDRYQLNPRAACCAVPEPPFVAQTHSEQMRPANPAGVWPHGCREPLYVQEPLVNHSRGFAGPSNWPQDRSLEETECLEPPLPLMSDVNCTTYIPPRYPAARMRAPCK